MLGRWLAYIALLLCGGAFYLFYPGYLSFYTLVLLCALPLLSLLLALPRWRLTALTLRPHAAETPRGRPTCLRLLLTCPRLPAGAEAQLTLRTENLLFPQENGLERLSLTPERPLDLPVDALHCGWLRFTPLRCTVSDCMGLFALPISLPSAAMVLVLPQALREPPLPDLAPQPGSPLRPRPGGGPGEEYELRPYRPGDPVKAIHWKLTAKRPDDEDPILRETLEHLQETLAVLYDHFGSPDAVDAALDRLQALAHALLELERPFTLVWTHPRTGLPTCYEIDCPLSWERCLRAISAQPAPETGRASVPDPGLLPRRPDAVRWLRPEGEEAPS